MLTASFQSSIADYLHSANLCDYDVLCSHDSACVSSEHKAQIISLYFHLCNSLSTATNLHFGQSHLNSKVRKTVPGWNDFVLDAKATASDAHQLWCQWNKPRNGPVFDLMQRTRAQYKYAIRYCRHHDKKLS